MYTYTHTFMYMYTNTHLCTNICIHIFICVWFICILFMCVNTCTRIIHIIYICNVYMYIYIIYTNFPSPLLWGGYYCFFSMGSSWSSHKKVIGSGFNPKPLYPWVCSLNFTTGPFWRHPLHRHSREHPVAGWLHPGTRLVSCVSSRTHHRQLQSH